MIINLPHAFTPRPYQIPFLKAWDSGIKRLILVAHRRCLAEGTRVSMSDGTFKNIEDIKIGNSVLSWDGKRLVPQKVLNVFDNGEATVFKYNELEATTNHQVLDNRFKWTNINDSSHLVNAGELSFGKIHNPELAELLGLLLSDGSITWNQTPRFTNIDPVLLERFEYLLSQTFPECNPKRYSKGRGFDILCTLKEKTGRKQHPFRKYFKDSNSMPSIVWDFDKESTLAFLSGAISGDGSFDVRKTCPPSSKKAYLSGNMVIEAGISPELAEDYKLVLMKFGIRAHIKKDPRGNNTRVYCYSLKRLHGLKGIKVYSKHKQAHLQKIWKDTVPSNNFLLEIIHRDPLSRSAHVYDIEVENTHNYVANGYIVHNCGKDKMVFANIPKMMQQRIGTYFYFLPTYTQAKKVIWTGADGAGFKFLDHFPSDLVKDINQTEMRITMTNGSILQMVGADNIDRIVGTNPIGVVFSEYALMKSDVWDYISPILAENGGWAVFVYTPRGQNHAYTLMKNAKKNPKWHVEILPVTETNAVKQEDLLEQQMNMSKDLYAQEYLCDFSQDATAVFKDIRKHTYPVAEYKMNDFGHFQIGVDLAKVNDFTVITPFDLTTFVVSPQDAFNKIDYTLQKAKISSAYYKYNKGRVVLDSTNNVSVSDDLLNQGINVAPYNFTFNSRNELLINLQLLLEQGRIKIPDDPELIAQLEAAVWDQTPGGRSKVVVPEPMHDDHLMSLALAVWDIPFRPIAKQVMQRVTDGESVSSYVPMYEEWGI